MDKSQILRVAKELQIKKSSETNTVIFHGKSMLPFLQDGDELVIASVVWDKIKKGDIITYRHEDKFPTRRVVKKRGQQLVLWCEGWPKLRFEALRDDVVGQAVARRRDDSWLKAEQLQWQLWTLRALLIYAALKTSENYQKYGFVPTVRTIWQKAAARTRHTLLMISRRRSV